MCTCSSRSQTTFLTLVGVIGLFMICFLFFWLGYLAGQTNALEVARQKVAQVLPVAPEEVFVITAKVKSVGDGKIQVESSPISINPLEPQGPTVRTVVVSPETTLDEVTYKNGEQLNKEAQEYQTALEAAQKSGGSFPSAPLPFFATALELTGLHAGDTLTISAKENIRDAAEFTATQIHRTAKASN